MTPQEKWDRMNSPSCLEDYGLSMNEDELRQFRQGRIILDSIKRVRKDNADFRASASALGASFAKVREKIFASHFVVTGD